MSGEQGADMVWVSRKGYQYYQAVTKAAKELRRIQVQQAAGDGESGVVAIAAAELEEAERVLDEAIAAGE